MMNDEQLLNKINEVVRHFGCSAVELGPNAVGVMGDARQVGASVYIKFPPNPPDELIQQVSTEVINKVRGVTRVLMVIA